MWYLNNTFFASFNSIYILCSIYKRLCVRYRFETFGLRFRYW